MYIEIEIVYKITCWISKRDSSKSSSLKKIKSIYKFKYLTKLDV